MKRTLMLRFICGGLAGVLIVFAGCSPAETEKAETGSAAEPAVEKQTTQAETKEAKQDTGSDASLWAYDQPLGEPVATLGDAPSWTETTRGAANKGTTGIPATVVGEVVDVSCYMQLGKRGEAHIPCGTSCVTNGAPIGLVDKDNDLYILMAEEHDPRRYGNVVLKEALVPFMARTVEVTGMLTKKNGVNTLYVLGYTVGDNPNQPRGE
jgi:hypothetical protein